MPYHPKPYPTVSHALIPITRCLSCPHCQTSLTKGYGYATDFHCSATKDQKLIAGYVEWDSEAPQENEIPQWCPYAIRVLITEETP